MDGASPLQLRVGLLCNSQFYSTISRGALLMVNALLKQPLLL
jgi:hypothetical protein